MYFQSKMYTFINAICSIQFRHICRVMLRGIIKNTVTLAMNSNSNVIYFINSFFGIYRAN